MIMKKIFLNLVVLLISVIASAQNYSFSIAKSGTGKQALLFIPGFACSGDVWEETVMELKDNYTCYVLYFTRLDFVRLFPVQKVEI